MDFFQELYEARMLINKQALKKYSAEDIADLTFLHLLTLELFRKEFFMRPIAINYAVDTYRGGVFQYFKPSGTDLYNLLHVVTHPKNIDTSIMKDPQDSQDMFEDMYVNPTFIRWYLKMVAGMAEVNEGWIRRFFWDIQSRLLITDQHYRSMRQLVLHYDPKNSYRKQLIVTRLLMAYRARAPRSDLREHLEKFAKKQKLEMKGELCNPETGRGCRDEDEPQPVNKQPNKAAWQAADNFAAGLAVGYFANRQKEDKNAGQRDRKRK